MMNYSSYSSAGLTLNINAANIPIGPNLVPPPPPVLKEEAIFIGESKQSFVNEPFSLNTSPSNPPSTSASRPGGQLRSRYVLPPQLGATNSPNTNPAIPPISNLLTSAPNFISGGDQSVESIRMEQSNEEVPRTNFQAEYFGPTYEQVTANWFYATKLNSMTIWWPFDICDSVRLETEASKLNLLTLPPTTEESPASYDIVSVTVPVRGGRYDVLLRERQCRAVYWDEERSEVRRVTWLFRPQNEPRVLPFSERMCALLEEQFHRAWTENAWGEKFTLPSEENESVFDSFIFHGPQSMIQYPAFPFRSYPCDDHHAADTASNVCILHRGLQGDLSSQLAMGDTRPIEHVVFVVHGIGPIYNVRGEGLVACVNDMRRTAESLMVSHFPEATGRAEFLPVHWHSALHSEATGINNQLRRVTLESIPKLRNFTNNTLTDILFYTSPKYCQHITNTVASSVIRLKQLFLQRNPHFLGDFSIVGHSLGSVIVFDLLSHQNRNGSSPQSTVNSEDDERFSVSAQSENDDWSLVAGDRADDEVLVPPTDVAASSDVSSVFDDSTGGLSTLRAKLVQAKLSEAQIRTVLKSVSKNSRFSLTSGVGMPVIQFPQLGFPFSACFLLGSPLPLFLTARGIDRLPNDFRLPTCSSVFNIFHPFDPVAYRMETILVPGYKPDSVLMPHHKGRKRIHLELKENLARVGSDIKSRVYESLRSTWRTFQEFASAHSSPPNKSADDQRDAANDDESDAIKRLLSRIADTDEPSRMQRDYDALEDEDEETTMFSSQLNQGRRIDFVLQEAPLESLNAYLFALTSHGVYWESEDCVLFMLNEVFAERNRQNMKPLGSGFSESGDIHLTDNNAQLMAAKPRSVQTPHFPDVIVKNADSAPSSLREIPLSFQSEPVVNSEVNQSAQTSLPTPFTSLGDMKSSSSTDTLDRLPIDPGLGKYHVHKGSLQFAAHPPTGQSSAERLNLTETMSFRHSPNQSPFLPVSWPPASSYKNQPAPMVYSHSRLPDVKPQNSAPHHSPSSNILVEFDLLHSRDNDQKKLVSNELPRASESGAVELVGIELNETDRYTFSSNVKQGFSHTCLP